MPHPVLGPRLESSVHDGTSFWEAELDTAATPLLRDHRVRGEMVLPAAVFVDLALAAVTEAFGPGAHALVGTEFKKPLLLGRDGRKKLQLVVAPDKPGSVSFQFRVLGAPDPGSQRRWPVCAAGTVRLGREGLEAASDRVPLKNSEALSGLVSSADHYRQWSSSTRVRTCLQAVEQIWRRDGRPSLFQTQQAGLSVSAGALIPPSWMPVFRS
jgi:acyl transferase domain-containing protein